MDTKLKKHNPIFAFLVYFLSINALITSLYILFLSMGFFAWEEELFDLPLRDKEITVYGKTIFLAFIGTALVSLLIFLLVRFKKKEALNIVEEKLAVFTGWFWVELKVLAVLTTLFLLFHIPDFEQLFLFIVLLCAFWGFWLIGVDLRFNGKHIFAHNSIFFLKNILDRFDRDSEFCTRMKKRILFFLISEFSLAVFALFLLLVLGEAGLLIDLLLVGLGIYLLVWYVNVYNKDIDAFAEIIEYIAKIRAGIPSEPLNLPPENAFFPLAADLNDIFSYEKIQTVKKQV